MLNKIQTICSGPAMASPGSRTLFSLAVEFGLHHMPTDGRLQAECTCLAHSAALNQRPALSRPRLSSCTIPTQPHHAGAVRRRQPRPPPTWMIGMIISTGKSFMALEYRLIQKPANSTNSSSETHVYQFPCTAAHAGAWVAREVALMLPQQRSKS